MPLTVSLYWQMVLSLTGDLPRETGMTLVWGKGLCSLTFPREGNIVGAVGSQRARSQGWREATLTSGSITVEKLSMVM